MKSVKNAYSLGGIARAKSLSSRRRKEIAAKAAKARWSKSRTKSTVSRARSIKEYTRPYQLKEKPKLKKNGKDLSKCHINCLRQSVLSFIHDRKDYMTVVECKNNYVIVAKRIKIITTEVANAGGFQPVERVTESFKVVMFIVALHNNDGAVIETSLAIRKKLIAGNLKLLKMRDFLCRQLLLIGCPVITIQSEEDINKKLVMVEGAKDE